MAKLLPLNEAFMPQFLKMLSAGMTFGPVLAKRSFVKQGSLAVWVQDEITELLPETTLLYGDRRDLAPSSEELEEAMFHLFNGFFKRKAHGILVADTPWSPVPEKWVGPPYGFPWFSCESPRKHSIKQVSVFLTRTEWGPRWKYEVSGVVHRNPATIVLTSLPREMRFRSGEHYRLESEVIQSAIERVEHILLGIFDEDSIALWTRTRIAERGQIGKAEGM